MSDMDDIAKKVLDSPGFDKLVEATWRPMPKSLKKMVDRAMKNPESITDADSAKMREYMEKRRADMDAAYEQIDKDLEKP